MGLLTDDTDNEEKRDAMKNILSGSEWANVSEKVRALMVHLGIEDPNRITQGCDNNTFEIDSHKTKEGTSPAEIEARIDLVRCALRILYGPQGSMGETMPVKSNRWTTKTIPYKYEEIRKSIMENAVTKQLMAIGVHDLLNTLYFLFPQSATNYNEGLRTMIHAAFNGEEIVDTRKTVTVNSGEYDVLTDDEANDAWNDDLDAYIDEYILFKMPENMCHYFDRDAWKEDAKVDGRGHSVSRYDGEETEATDTVSGDTFYIYRQG